MNRDSIDIQNIRRFIDSLPARIVAKRRRVPVEEDFADDILPFDLYRKTRQNIEKIGDQINKSFYYQIYDGASVLMRRLVEMLLILAFKSIGQEEQIKGSNGNYLQLSQIINKATQNKTLDLSRNAKNYLGLFKEKGDLSAHNPFHTCRRRDLELTQQKFRYLVEELFYKAEILK